MSKVDPWDKKFQFMANQAVIDAWSRSRVSLDFSSDSVKLLEKYLDSIYRNSDFQAASEKDKRAEGMIAGAYLGEVLRRNFGGIWGTNSSAAGELSFPLKIGTEELFPTGWCIKRLENGPEDNVWDKYRYFVLKETNNVSGSLTFETNLSSATNLNSVSATSTK